jgi:hypothetical protein
MFMEKRGREEDWRSWIVDEEEDKRIGDWGSWMVDEEEDKMTGRLCC